MQGRGSNPHQAREDGPAISEPNPLIRVECYAGHKGEETPRRFAIGERRVEVVDVLDRWLAPDHRYFKIRTREGTFILRNDVASGDWELTLFKRDDVNR